jgi:hypothetical protein
VRGMPRSSAMAFNWGMVARFTVMGTSSVLLR